VRAPSLNPEVVQVTAGLLSARFPAALRVLEGEDQTVLKARAGREVE
jgi:hypothetical protein